ncbi:hypothetical protein C9374_003921 [Naegleria lovaniensis]|uniref:ABC transporter domain-containing protein n=1 Tax=Naegleria lovaniensis TaxID=51637 RepID=A0AA88H8T6_NAELO|nr:uncharacterized protein C9374_003921 [Naegleria lovaniensis]KAG2394157.1 hypothetical protein C9374_003921 [Naegleria lovaniensis]
MDVHTFSNTNSSSTVSTNDQNLYTWWSSSTQAWLGFLSIPLFMCVLCVSGLLLSLCVGFRNMIQFPKRQKQRRKLHRLATIRQQVTTSTSSHVSSSEVNEVELHGIPNIMSSTSTISTRTATTTNGIFPPGVLDENAFEEPPSTFNIRKNHGKQILEKVNQTIRKTVAFASDSSTSQKETWDAITYGVKSMERNSVNQNNQSSNSQQLQQETEQQHPTTSVTTSNNSKKDEHGLEYSHESTLQQSPSMKRLESMNRLKTVHAAPSMASKPMLVLYAPLLIVVALIGTFAVLSVAIVTAVTTYQVYYLEQRLSSFYLEYSSSKTTNRSMIEPYGTTHYVESLIFLSDKNTSIALFGLYSSNVTMRIILFKEYSLYETFDNTSSIDYYSSDVKVINDTMEGVIMTSWRLWDNSTVTTGNGRQNFTVLIQVENSSLPYSIRVHSMVEDEQYTLSRNFISLVWLLFLEFLVCLIAGNQIYLSMISYDPTNREHFLDEWVALFQCFSKKNSALTNEKDVTIEFKDLSFTSFEGQKILKNISGRIESGKLTAVMGSTGSGKSTFLTVLSKRAYYGVQKGTVTLNGKILTESMKKIIGFVPQDDIMISSLQVWETLMFSGIYRSMTNFFYPLVKRVKETADMLNIKKKLFSTIGDVNKKVLSGGEKKRLNVGIEMINDSPVLLLDEPTSGLDSKQALLLCNILAKKKQEGTNIICAIHQPSAEIYSLFDDLILFDHGRMIAHGDAQKIAQICAHDILHLDRSMKHDVNMEDDPHLEHVEHHEQHQHADFNNPGDHVIAALDIMNDEQRQVLSKVPPSLSTFQLNRGNYRHGETANSISVPTVPFYIQALAFFSRGLLLLFHEFSSFFLDVLINAISGLFIGAVFTGNLSYTGQSDRSIAQQCPLILYEDCSAANQDDISSFVCTGVFAIGLSSILSALSTFGKEKVVFRRESQTGLNTLVYFMVKDVLALIPIALSSFFYTLTSYLLIQPKASFSEYYQVYFLIAFATYPLGFIISICLRSDLAQIASAIVLFVCYLFSGSSPSVLEMSEMPLPYPFLPHLSFLKYANEMLYLSEIKYYTLYSKSVESKGYIQEMMQVNGTMLLSFALLFHVVAALCLWQSVPGSFVSTWYNHVRSKWTNVSSWCWMIMKERGRKGNK